MTTKPAKNTATKPATKSKATPAKAKSKPAARTKAKKTPAKTAAAKKKSAAKTPKALRELDELRETIAGWRAKKQKIALLPTMGALHEGHMSLCRLARKQCDRLVVSIFVNPTQFAPHEDLERYPRDESGDLKKLKDIADLVWAPDPADMYQPGFATRVVPSGAAHGLEADSRPHFFGGVATVCLKLFNQVAPDVAYYGEKDYQQLCVMRQMVRDLDLPMQIASGPTVREKDGLALSSRNAYLTPDEREIAPKLHETLLKVAEKVKNGTSPSVARAEARMRLIMIGFRNVDYIEVRDAESLVNYDRAGTRPGRVLAAAWLGRTRLIDNIPLE